MGFIEWFMDAFKPNGDSGRDGNSGYNAGGYDGETTYFSRARAHIKRAFLKTLKPRLVAIAEAVAEKTGPVDESDLHAQVDAGREEYHRELATAHNGMEARTATGDR